MRQYEIDRRLALESVCEMAGKETISQGEIDASFLVCRGDNKEEACRRLVEWMKDEGIDPLRLLDYTRELDHDSKDD